MKKEEKKDQSAPEEEVLLVKEVLVEESNTENIENEQLVAEDKNQNEKKKKNIIAYLIILILIVAAAVVIVLDYPKISTYTKNKMNPYGFDYNFKKISEYDWDTILTEKKIAGIWNTSRKNINSEKSPDSSWVLEDPNQFVNEENCADMLDEKILNQENQDKENLLNVSILLCKNIGETKTAYSSRKDAIKNASQTDNTITVKSMNDINELGDEGYAYLVEKASAKSGSAPDKYAGTVLRQGPFMVIIGESEQQSSGQQQGGFYYLSSNNMELKIAKYLDKQLQNILAWY